jgi:2-keto-4-pentenoate hydratase/2-oxohepta-3-ene-1,7-dioic acid hydratase in catechol pathway
VKLAAFISADGAPTLGRVDGEHLVVIGDYPGPQGIIDSLDANAARDDVSDSALQNRPRLRLSDVRILPPVMPGKVIAVAANYASHVLGSGFVAAHKDASIPRLFMKPPSCIVGAYDDILNPSLTDRLDYEAELAVIVGTRCRDVPVESALDVVAGYAVFNDVSARRMLHEGRTDDELEADRFFDWLHGKWFDTFGVLGPWLVSAWSLPSPSDLTVRLTVNGETRQEASLGDWTFSVEEVISFASRLCTLEPGDVVAMGTPAGTGAELGDYLKVGDVVETEIEGLGWQRNVVLAAPAVDASWRDRNSTSVQ